MTFTDVKTYVRQAKGMIPRRRMYEEFHSALARVLKMTSRDALRDIEVVCNACRPLPYEWGQSVVVLLERAAKYFRDQPYISEN